MKKKQLTGKLSLDKSRISALDSAKIKGGTNSPDTLFCVITRDGGCISANPTHCLGDQTGTEGSFCKCL